MYRKVIDFERKRSSTNIRHPKPYFEKEKNAKEDSRRREYLS